MSQGNWGGPPPGGYGYGPGAPPGSPPTPQPMGGYGASPPGPFPPPMQYDGVAWYRKNGINSAFVLLGFFCFPPLLWATCVIVLTGPVYMNAYDQQGQLKTWGAANKVVAVLMILVQFAGLMARILAR